MSMVACTHEDFPQPPKDEHPIVAILAVAAIVAAIVLIMWARLALHGTEDIEAALTDGPLLPATDGSPAASPRSKPSGIISA